MENEIIEVQTSAISEISRAEIDMQIATAKKYPRSIQKFRQDALSMATSDIETASSCFYKLKRSGKMGTSIIEGPSVRLAEICASAWGNVRYGARIVEDNGKEVIAQGVCHDLEKNVSTTIEVSRRITNKDGKRYSDDMVQVTKNAACSIALRNAIYKTIPFTYAKQIYEQAKLAAIGDVKTIGERRQSMVKAFSQISVSVEQLLDLVEKKSLEDVGIAEIETLIGVFNAIKEGDSTIDEQFGNKKQTIEDPFQNELASDTHINTIKKIVKDINSDVPIIDAFLVDFGVNKLEEITKKQAEELIAHLSKRLDGKK